MIPLKLTLKNFLCYRDNVPSLSLEGVHVACLCGQNGHGKSALLDAITWSLWGKARGKSQDELIHYGSDEMLVELEFLAREARYRVTRRHANGTARRRQGATDLQFQVHTEADYRPITGNSLRETQSKIDQIIGMDYDTFINSAFLLQGRADEFTNKSPGQRKEVLATILGLGYYDLLHDRAKERADEKRVAASVIEGDLERMFREVSHRDGYYSELEGVSVALGEANSRLETSREGLDVLRMQVDDLGRKLRELEELGSRIPSIQAEISHLQREMVTLQERIAGYQALVQKREAIEEGLAQYQQLRSRYEELNRSREQFDDLLKRKSDLERTIEGARAGLEERIKQLKNRVEVQLRPRADAVATISAKLEEERARLDELNKEDQDLADRRRYLQELSAKVGRFEASAQQLKAQGQELRSKLNLVQNSQEGAWCPLCGTELGPQGNQHLSDNYDAQIEEKLSLYRENESALEKTEKEKLGLEGEIPASEAVLRRGQKEAQSAVAAHQKELEESEIAAVELESVKRELAQEEPRLGEGVFAALEREQLGDVQAKIAALGYDQDTHRRLYGQVQGLQPYEERHRRLEDAEVNLPRDEESLARTRDMYQRRHEEIQASIDKQRDMEAEVSGLPQWRERLEGAEKAYQVLENRQKGLFRRQVELETELKKLEALEREIDDKKGGLKSLREQQAVYKSLDEAFGKRGVQAMLIETVLPTIEDEANALLGRMTDNRMHLKLESQRERRSGKGEPIETLEIKIGDEMGTRSYEMFSGGEAFRINLALRIALSKVLAHRSGAPLPTLFIDEGFGTQDASGREKILDVIRAIEDDFEKIIVITHLDEVKEAFPVRIEVQKDESGSTFWIS